MKLLKPDLDDLLELRHQAHRLGIASSRSVNAMLSGLYQSVFRGQGVDFEEVRAYREGDEIRNMDWRVTARTNIPHLKVFREERQRTVILCVDVGLHMNFGTRGTFKSVQAARAAALLGWAATANHDKLGGLLYGGLEGVRLFQPGSSRRALWQMLKSMSDVSPNSNPANDPLLHMLKKLMHTPTGSLLFLIGDFTANLSGLEQSMGRLMQKHEVVLVPIDDIVDREIPAMGRVVFADTDGQEFLLNTDDEGGRQRYAAAWKEKRTQLEKRCKQLRVDMIPVKTDDDIHIALAQGLKKRAYRMASR